MQIILRTLKLAIPFEYFLIFPSLEFFGFGSALGHFLLYASACPEMGCPGARAIAEALPRFTRTLELLKLESNGIGDQGKAMLHRGWASLLRSRIAPAQAATMLVVDYWVEGLFLEEPIVDEW